MGEEIDFVVTWVDGSDKAWQTERKKYERPMARPDGTEGGSGGAAVLPKMGAVDDGEERYRDWGLFRYWFRGVERFAPWVRKVHLVTWGHLPGWLDASHPKLRVVRHEDYIPGEFLPTFNSNVLEIYLHKIEGLSQNFVYFNDDMHLVGPVRPEDFFMGGKPCDMLAFQPVVANPRNPVMSHLFLNDSLVLCKYFDKRENVRRQPGKYFKLGYPPLYFFYNLLELAFPLYTGFYTVHGPSPFRKDTFEEVWEREGELLARMSSNRFRSSDDVMIYLFREWQKLSGNFVPRNVQRMFRYYEVGREGRPLGDILSRGKKKVVCVNDGKVAGNEDGIRRELTEAFERILPDKSSFER